MKEKAKHKTNPKKRQTQFVVILTTIGVILCFAIFTYLDNVQQYHMEQTRESVMNQNATVEMQIISSLTADVEGTNPFFIRASEIVATATALNISATPDLYQRAYNATATAEASP
ncbi:MAG: hypothetical protein AAFV93_25070 [Chloroflexota bacterium]